MSLWKIAWRSIQQRGVASSLTMFSMALGVMMVVAVLLIHGIVTQSFKSNSSLGYNMIVGAKGGRLQLVLNTVYYLSQPVENVPYEFYLDFLTADELQQLIDDGIHTTAEIDALLVRRREAQSARERAALEELPAAEQRRELMEGKYAYGVDDTTKNLAIPVCLGDYYKQYRLVGTTPKLFDDLEYVPEKHKKYAFAAGENFKTRDDKVGYFGAVVGSMVAKEHQVKVGDKLYASHGAAEGEGQLHDEGAFTVTGILAPSGTPVDRGVFVNMEGFYLMEGHAKIAEEDLPPDDTPPTDAEAAPEPAEPAAAAAAKATLPGRKPLPLSEREVTAILFRTDAFASMAFQNEINEGQIAQAVMPIFEITSLWEIFVTPLQTLLLVLTGLICVVSGVSILVSMYNSMSDRKHEIAVMRALGAGRQTVMMIVLIEAIVLALLGGLLGWLMGHLGVLSAGGVIEDRTGVVVNPFDFVPAEVVLIPALILLAVIVGFIPALTAYRTDVAKSLQ